MALILDIHPINPQMRLINKVTEIIQKGGVIAYPTDSGYALGCALGNKSAMERIVKIRKLNRHHHFTLMLKDLSHVGEYAKLNNSGFRLLKKNEAIEVYEYLDPIVQQTLLDRLRSGEVLEIVEKMSPDDRVQLFDELPAKVVRKFLSALSPGERKVTAELLGYEPETAGRLMTTEFIDLKEMQTAEEALSIVRKRAAFTETIYSLYVTDKERHLTGILSLRDLVTADPKRPIGEVMTRSRGAGNANAL